MQHPLLPDTSCTMGRPLATRAGAGPECCAGTPVCPALMHPKRMAYACLTEHACRTRFLGGFTYNTSWHHHQLCRAACYAACAWPRWRPCMLPLIKAEPSLPVSPCAALHPLELPRALPGAVPLGRAPGRGGLHPAGPAAGLPGAAAPGALHLRGVGLWRPALVAGLLRGASHIRLLSSAQEPSCRKLC